MRKLLVLLTFQGLFIGCTPKANNDRFALSSVKPLPIVEQAEGFTISFPEGWKEVPGPHVQSRLLWGVDCYNRSVWLEKSRYIAWDAPDEERSFFTCMKLKRDRTLGVSHLFDDLMPDMKEYFGATVQEKGNTTISGKHAKWWIQTFAEGAIQQKCYMVGCNDYIYCFCFTTGCLSDERLQLFNQIAQSVLFTDA